MPYCPLGSTGIEISAIAFGAGPVSGLMTGSAADRQLAVLRRAIERGVNWIDTAATYGQGRSEQSLGTALARLGRPADVHVATKVRLMPEHLDRIGETVRQSFAGSLQRLGVERVTLLQLHNSITARRGDEPTSLSPEDVLGRGGVLEAFEQLRARGVVRLLGLTGIGQPAALRDAIASEAFQTIQIPYHVLNPSAGRVVPEGFVETNYGNVIADCASRGMGVLAIRVFAAGALLGNAPSAHTQTTPFFPLELYQHDVRRAEELARLVGPDTSLRDLALRFALSHPAVSAALIGFGEPGHIDDAVAAAADGPLSEAVLHMLSRYQDDALRKIP